MSKVKIDKCIFVNEKKKYIIITIIYELCN